MRSDKPWLPLEETQLERIGAQLGVFELGDESGRVLYIGAADARSLFGLRGELERRIGSAADSALKLIQHIRPANRNC